MNHPLTDEMCNSIAPWPIKRLPGEYVSMRAVADWQLEQVIEWLNDNVGMLILSTESELDTRYLESLEEEFTQNFKEAMRPQENDS